MLQISTGKFFEEEKQRKHDEKFVFYSNVQIFKDICISSPKIKVKQVESGDVSCFIVSYTLITEEHPIIIKCGGQDFIQHFLLVWSFFFDCIAKVQKENVQKICREKKSSSNDKQTASEISPRTVSLGRRLESTELTEFGCFIDTLMSTNRSTYKSIIAALKIIDDAKETLSTNFDLAYSTMVYAIESLSQKHDNYTPSWDDYDEDVKRKVEVILDQIDEDKSDAIKIALVEGKQFKLRKRLETFVLSHLSEAYFRKYLGKNTNTMRTSFLQKSLNNLYQLRSSFVHELKPLDVMLSSPHSPASDYIMRFGKPYFTFSGLNRMMREIIINFTKRNVSNDSEIIEWTSETSSTIVGEMAAQCWIHNPNGFCGSKANKWFQAYIEMLNAKKVTDQSEIMNKIESIFDGEKKQNKTPLIHYYWLYSAIHNRDADNWSCFIDKRKEYIGGCFNFYIVILYLYNELSFRTIEKPDCPENIDLDEFDQLYEKYLQERFHKSGLSLSGYTEAGLLSAAANIALELGDKVRFEGYLNKALGDVSNKREKYSLIEKSLQQFVPVDMNEYFKSEGDVPS
ncbi:hypothetical protein ACT3OH_15270 [Vreelandella zhanjiangensis]|uniref:hypothetical protein n=1 Tax=Vreelandella zhanjiangensis TaxID=1121960 RepID=UPI00402A9C0E